MEAHTELTVYSKKETEKPVRNLSRQKQILAELLDFGKTHERIACYDRHSGNRCAGGRHFKFPCEQKHCLYFHASRSPVKLCLYCAGAQERRRCAFCIGKPGNCGASREYHRIGGKRNMAVLQTQQLTKIYGSGESRVIALNHVSLSVEKGEFVAVVGTSGSGKSTLLHMLGGLDRPTEGTVFVDGRDIFSLRDEALTIFRRRKIGFVFQAYNLVPTLNVYENIVFPVQLDGNRVDQGYVGEVVRLLGLDGMQKRLPNQLSGGQQQRVAIARALAAKPAIILADEPTGNLDSRTSQDVLSLLKVTGQKFSQTIVMITHNEAIAQMADRVVRIEDGRILYGGEADA